MIPTLSQSLLPHSSSVFSYIKESSCSSSGMKQRENAAALQKARLMAANSEKLRRPQAMLPNVLLLNRPPAKRSRGQMHYSLFSKEPNTIKCTSNQPLNNDYVYDDILLKHWRLNKRFVSGCGFFVLKPESFSWWRKCVISIQKVLQCTKWLSNPVPVLSIYLIVGVMFYMAFSAAVTKTPSWALSEENLIFLEAWRTIDRAYIDKSFNGQSWFRYRENALRNEPMSTRGETYAAIRKMVATLDDPFTRFLEPQKFKSLRAVRNTKYSYWSRAFNWLP